MGLTGPYWALLGLLLGLRLIELYSLSHGLTGPCSGPYWAFLGLTEPYLALLSLTGPYWALLGLTGPYWELYCIC